MIYGEIFSTRVVMNGRRVIRVIKIGVPKPIVTRTILRGMSEQSLKAICRRRNSYAYLACNISK